MLSPKTPGWRSEGTGKGKVTFLLLLLLGLSVCPSEYFWVSSIGFGCWLTMPSHIDKGKRKDLFFTSGVQIFAFQVPWLKGWEVSCRLQDHYRPEVNKVYSERASGVVKFRTGSLWGNFDQENRSVKWTALVWIDWLPILVERRGDYCIRCTLIKFSK